MLKMGKSDIQKEKNDREEKSLEMWSEVYVGVGEVRTPTYTSNHISNDFSSLSKNKIPEPPPTEGGKGAASPSHLQWEEVQENKSIILFIFIEERVVQWGRGEDFTLRLGKYWQKHSASPWSPSWTW